jgi:hypothetical protein
MLKFVLILMIFSCSNIYSQEKILIGKEYQDVIEYVKTKSSSYDEVTYDNNITIYINYIDSNYTMNSYAIEYKTNKCIYQIHTFANPIPIETIVHIMDSVYIIQTSKIVKNKYRRIYYESSEREILHRISQK